MKFALKSPLIATFFALGSLTISSTALAVGNGVDFGVDEDTVPGAFSHQFVSDSMDFTYHACTSITAQQGNPDEPGQNVRLRERGYFWISSYQDDDGVLDSQINHFLANGYHVYGVYEFGGPRVASGQGPLGFRAGYQIQSGNVTLYVDPQQDTLVDLFDCELGYVNTQDDWKIGESMDVLAGEKSEKTGLANGDFEVVYGNWVWSIPDPIVPVAGMNILHLNANVTSLGGPLNGNHRPEGSGNLFWKID